jgi:hypothetical protein
VSSKPPKKLFKPTATQRKYIMKNLATASRDQIAWYCGITGEALSHWFKANGIIKPRSVRHVSSQDGRMEDHRECVKSEVTWFLSGIKLTAEQRARALALLDTMCRVQDDPTYWFRMANSTTLAAIAISILHNSGITFPRYTNGKRVGL